MIKQYDYLFKIVIIGNSSVGKSSILRRFSDDSFQQSYLATIGVDFRFKSLKVDDGDVKLQIWDTAGQQRFRTITSAYYKGAHGIFITYDATNQQSFNDIQDFWIGQVEKYGEPNVVLSILGNKSDLQNTCLKQQIEQFCNEKNILHFDVSAKEGNNVSLAFKQMCEKLTKIHPKIDKKQTSSQVVSNVLKKKKDFKLKAGVQRGPVKKSCC